MIEIELNPPQFVETYLASLNACFPGWGDRRAYAWAFERRVSGPAPDLMVLREGGVLLAGSAVSYRAFRCATGQRALVGIMTGSWTLPAARGRGCFSRIVDESVSLVRGRGGALLLAYVTETNASFRRLEVAGSALFATRYVFSRPETPATASGVLATVVENPAADLDGWFGRFEQRREPGATITYATAPEWRSQFLDRPGTSSIVEAGSLGFCVVEEHSDTDRLQGIASATPADRVPLIRAMLARAQERGRKLFFFSANPVQTDACAAELGLGQTAGYLTMLPADPAALSGLLSGPVSREALAQAPAFARWALHSGDRM